MLMAVGMTRADVGLRPGTLSPDTREVFPGTRTVVTASGLQGGYGGLSFLGAFLLGGRGMEEMTLEGLPASAVPANWPSSWLERWLQQSGRDYLVCTRL